MRIPGLIFLGFIYGRGAREASRGCGCDPTASPVDDAGEIDAEALLDAQLDDDIDPNANELRDFPRPEIEEIDLVDEWKLELDGGVSDVAQEDQGLIEDRGDQGIQLLDRPFYFDWLGLEIMPEDAPLDMTEEINGYFDLQSFADGDTTALDLSADLAPAGEDVPEEDLLREDGAGIDRAYEDVLQPDRPQEDIEGADAAPEDVLQTDAPQIDVPADIRPDRAGTDGRLSDAATFPEPDFLSSDLLQTDYVQTDWRQSDREPQSDFSVPSDEASDAAPEDVLQTDAPQIDVPVFSDWQQPGPECDLQAETDGQSMDTEILPDIMMSLDIPSLPDNPVILDMSLDTTPDLAPGEDLPQIDLAQEDRAQIDGSTEDATLPPADVDRSDLLQSDWPQEDVAPSDLREPDVPVCMYDNYLENDFTGFPASNVIGGAGEASLSLAPIPWTNIYDGSVFPETVGWRENAPQDPFTWTIKEVVDGVLHISTMGTEDTGRFEKDTIFNNVAGWVVEVALQNIDNSDSGLTGDGLMVNINDNARRLQVRFLNTRILDIYANPDNFFDMDTKNGFHVYTIIAQGNNYYVKVDNTLTMDGTDLLLTLPSSPNSIMFGDYSFPDSESKWDYVQHLESGIWPVTGILTGPTYDAWEGYPGVQLTGATISWQQDPLPMGQRIEMQVCGGEQPDLSDGRCTSVLTNSAGESITDDKLGRYLRWQATFHGLNVDTPKLKSVNLEFTRCHY